MATTLSPPMNLSSNLIVDERNFKLLKTDLKLRPAYVWTPKHIHAYILLSIIALDVLRFLERSMDLRFTVEQIVRELRNFIAVPYFEGGYLISAMFPVTSALQKETGKEFDHIFISAHSLKRMFKLR